MGRDIHVVLEKKNGDRWNFFDPGFDLFDARNYAFFSFLEEIADPGCPEELKNQRLRSGTEQWVDQAGNHQEETYYLWDTTEPCCLYGFGHITLKKLAEEAQKLHTLWVSTEFLERFYLLGGKLPEGMRIAEEAANADGETVEIRVMDEEDLRLRDYIDTGISELKRIAAEQKLPEDELRICFAFDC